jgi:hypothetical protein
MEHRTCKDIGPASLGWCRNCYVNEIEGLADDLATARQTLTDLEASVSASFCEAHQWPHQSCPCCEAVHQADEVARLTLENEQLRTEKTMPRVPTLLEVHRYVSCLPNRVEPLGGQQTTYVQRATVLDWLEVEIEKELRHPMSEEQDRIAALTAEDYQRIDHQQDDLIARLYARLEARDTRIDALEAENARLKAIESRYRWHASHCPFKDSEPAPNT